MDELRSLLKEIGPGRMSNTAYDTAWVARLGDIDTSVSNRALDWLINNQLPDGSWGAASPMYYHDRVICTLAAMIALTHRGRRSTDRKQIERGLVALEAITNGATRGLKNDLNGATVAFEMITPTLIKEAEELNIIKGKCKSSILGKFAQQRERKLGIINNKRIDRRFTMSFSAEMAGLDGKHMLDVENLQETNGSVGNSPSASAYFAINIKPGDRPALDYILRCVKSDGGTPDVAPFDVFEPAWSLWNLNLLRNGTPSTMNLIQPHLDFLKNAWHPGMGIGHAACFTPKDSDDSGLVFDLLCQYNKNVDIEALFRYEEKDHFRCYDLEADPSISANIHVLGALQQAGYKADHPAVTKIIIFLRKSRSQNMYWLDKWHASPYYATSHAVIILSDNFDGYLSKEAVDWILKTQKPDGSWGSYETSTAEETAYCLQALCVYRRHWGNIPAMAIKKGADWLEQNSQPPYEPLWIGKALYCPELVVKSTILSALALVKQGVN
jgi:halimadienyl-diphosphate synthase